MASIGIHVIDAISPEYAGNGLGYEFVSFVNPFLKLLTAEKPCCNHVAIKYTALQGVHSLIGGPNVSI
jgi:hypothetical protein